MANINKSKPTVRLGNSQGYLTLYGNTALAVELITLIVMVFAVMAYITKALK